MSKVTTKRLSRGVRMLAGHVVGQLKTLLQQPGLAQISTENLTDDKGTFRINLHVPVIKGQNTGATKHLPIWVPFTLPATQEYFQAAPSTGVMPDIDGNYPRAVLTELAFSFDQRSEAAAITRAESSAPVIEGKLSYDQATRLGLQVSLYSKEMKHWSATAPTTMQEREITFDLPAAAFVGTRLRLNPTVQSNLNVPINPLRTYMIEINCDELTSATAIPLQLNSVMISLKFEQRLMGRETNYPGGSLQAQNMPTSHKGIIPTSPATITEPTTASEPIRAGTGGTGTGIQTSFETVDKFFQRLLRGGVNQRSGVAATQQILQDSAYEVIAVPMFGNTEGIYNSRNALAPVTNGVISSDMPYNPLVQGHLYDMRRIPIRHPFVVHHVVAVANWSPNKASTNVTVPVQNTAFTNSIGVGLGSGHFSEAVGWQSVAYAQWTEATRSTYVIDQCNRNDGTPQQGLGFDLMTIPLVGSSSNSSIGTGYSALNGKPVFAGQASSPNQPRSALADGVDGAIPGARVLEGKEQWIEVRWLISDTVTKFAGGAGAYQDTDIFVGNGGNWVFLIGKKYLA